MNNAKDKVTPLSSATPPKDWHFADIDHQDNIVLANDLLEFMQATFETQNTLMLTPAAARGAGLVLSRIQDLMLEQTQLHKHS